MKIALDFGGSKQAGFDKKILKDIIVDRKSKYSVVGGKVNSREDVAIFMKSLLSDSYFAKATHNTYAYRVTQENGSILESRSDDGETGAGNCILSELQRESIVNTVVVVTRYFGGVQLHADRFKNVIDATKIFLQNI